MHCRLCTLVANAIAVPPCQLRPPKLWENVMATIKCSLIPKISASLLGLQGCSLGSDKTVGGSLRLTAPSFVGVVLNHPSASALESQQLVWAVIHRCHESAMAFRCGHRMWTSWVVTCTMASLQAHSEGQGHAEGRGESDSQALQRT